MINTSLMSDTDNTDIYYLIQFASTAAVFHKLWWLGVVRIHCSLFKICAFDTYGPIVMVSFTVGNGSMLT